MDDLCIAVDLGKFEAAETRPKEGTTVAGNSPYWVTKNQQRHTAQCSLACKKTSNTGTVAMNAKHWIIQPLNLLSLLLSFFQLSFFSSNLPSSPSCRFVLSDSDSFSPSTPPLLFPPPSLCLSILYYPRTSLPLFSSTSYTLPSSLYLFDSFITSLLVHDDTLPPYLSRWVPPILRSSGYSSQPFLWSSTSLAHRCWCLRPQRFCQLRLPKMTNWNPRLRVIPL